MIHIAEENHYYVIPPNFDDNRIGGMNIRMRNIIEAVVVFAIVFFTFAFLPISLIAKAVVITVLGGGLGIFFLVGIRHHSITEFLWLFIKFKRQQKTIYKSDMFTPQEEGITEQSTKSSNE